MDARELFKRWYAALVPGTCLLCGQRVPNGGDFCAGCDRALPRLTAGCPSCAAPLDGCGAGNAPCGQCQREPPAYARVRAPFRYAPPIDRLIQGAKYAGRLDWLAVLANRLAVHLARAQPSVDLVVPVPLHRSRLRARGYNQALEIARPVAKRLGVPARHALLRVQPTPPQTDLSREERRRNVHRAFALRDVVRGARVALVDDVMTSGATAEAAARCLRAAGAATVEIWVVARA